jgi:hypothetical protein
MNADQYVQSVVNKYSVDTSPNSAAAIALQQVVPITRAWADKYLSSQSVSGSYAKDTAVTTGTDIDLFISLVSDTPGKLSDLYESLYKYMTASGWTPRRQNVSIGISQNGIHIDLVPGRIQVGYQNVHSLYKSKTGSWIQTNVKLQINTVRDSSRTDEIKAIKIWRDLHKLDITSFYLELLTIRALKGKHAGNLANHVSDVLLYIADSIATSRIVDPANTNNVISDDLTVAAKQKIASQARGSVEEKFWENVIW